MSELQRVLDEAYALAKAGHWNRLLARWADAPVLARRCSRYVHPGSGWTFLHQAAYFGQEPACRALIGRGAAIDLAGKDGRRPVDVAQQKGHAAVAGLLRQLMPERDSPWAPPLDPDVLPSSCSWSEAQQLIAPEELYVAYGGGVITIPKGASCFVDGLQRVLVGFHGTFDPPCGMDGESMLDDDE